MKCFPLNIREIISNEIDENEIDKIEEIRVRNNLPLILKVGQTQKILNYKIKTDEMNYIFQKICENSIYTYQNQIAQGFITIQGGNRVGIVGTAVMKDGVVSNFNYISSLNFRISRQIIGCSDKIMKEIVNSEDDSIYNTLIVAPPGMGKTTLLRDIVRNISNSGKNVSVIDERSEISAMYRGIIQNDLGIRTDVINNIPKYLGMRMAIRSMAPDVVVADEIGSLEDVEAIRYAMCCGVKGIFTAHGRDIDEVKNNPELENIIKNKIFEKIILINGRRETEVKSFYKN